MDWGVVKIVVAIVAIALVAMIVSMLVGTVRSTRRKPKQGRPENWSHTKDQEFLPWEDDDR